MTDWSPVIEDRSKSSRLWKARGREGEKGGCLICGASDHVRQYSFGRRRSQGGRYEYALPVREYLCEDCVRWEYRHKIAEKGMGIFGLIMCLGLLAFSLSELIHTGLSGLGGSAFGVLVLAAGGAAGTWFIIRYLFCFRKINDRDGETALFYIYTGSKKCTEAIRKGRGYYFPKESVNAPEDPLVNSFEEERILTGPAALREIKKQETQKESMDFSPYTGHGACDVCNRPLGNIKAWIVPTNVFYASPEYREQLKDSLLRMTGRRGTDADIDRMQAGDRSPGSAVCEHCIHMFR